MREEDKKAAEEVEAMEQQQEYKKPSFLEELRKLINSHGVEAGSDTADYILAMYLNRCLDAFHFAVIERENFYGRRVGSPDYRVQSIKFHR